MATLAQRIAARSVTPGHLSAWWLGGAGFIFKAASGREVWIDPYLSDAAYDLFGLKRAFAAPIAVGEANPDLVIVTHWHEDHLDLGSIPALAKARPNAKFLMPPSAMARTLSWGVSRAQIIPLSHGQTVSLGDTAVTSVPARHVVEIAGWEVPDAMGIILEMDGIRIYHTGDTEYDNRLRRLKNQPLAFATFCINGSGGNMNAHEAALLAWQLDVKIAAPHHHYLWDKETVDPEETLDAKLFERTYRNLGGKAAVILPQIGVEIDIPL
jgi:L-ascorbate 6-phosphate lactonase